ncbi:hypothetical protein K443DRAFT_456637 [Laccaria amethystina LaAM-08-1]|uniref:Uncharacterized protein n=1 Tax=Laccaria amethystina LaAM-08-1 TaxID=1095629 RepID=A0A0C9XQE9_9AGAR|nr:hypothetical protein K443DRAFT_456637 [Laccaria amethystina LaAM-08-1]
MSRYYSCIQRSTLTSKGHETAVQLSSSILVLFCSIWMTSRNILLSSSRTWTLVNLDFGLRFVHLLLSEMKQLPCTPS